MRFKPFRRRAAWLCTLYKNTQTEANKLDGYNTAWFVFITLSSLTNQRQRIIFVSFLRIAHLSWTFCSFNGFRLVRGVGALVTTARELVSFSALQISIGGKYTDAAVTLGFFFSLRRVWKSTGNLFLVFMCNENDNCSLCSEKRTASIIWRKHLVPSLLVTGINGYFIVSCCLFVALSSMNNVP